MNAERRTAIVAGAVALLLVASALVSLGCRNESGMGEGGGEGGDAGGPTSAVTLYFPGPDGRLHGEQRELAQGRLTEQSRAIVEALLEGPRDESLSAPLAPEIEVGSVLVGVGGIAYVDLRRSGEAPPIAAGSLEERLAIYSVVNSIALNNTLIEAVTLLWNGSQVESFGGHLDTTVPLSPDATLLAEAR